MAYAIKIRTSLSSFVGMRKPPLMLSKNLSIQIGRKNEAHCLRVRLIKSNLTLQRAHRVEPQSCSPRLLCWCDFEEDDDEGENDERFNERQPQNHRRLNA